MTALIVAALIALVIALYLFLIAPSLKKRDMAAFSARLFAHRGLFDNVGTPENSMAAFTAARDRGFGIELDVHLTADGQLAVFHDNTLTRMCALDVTPEALTSAELSRIKLKATDECIPMFGDVLEMLNKSPVPLIVELKTETPDVSRLCDATVAALENYSGSCCVESFNPLALAYIRKKYPRVLRGVLSDAFMRDSKYRGKPKFFALHHMLLNFKCHPDFIAYNFENRDALSFAICRRLFRVTTAAWTVRSEDELKLCRGFDVKICEGFLK